jgi:parallel beta-helix repeat protein
MMKSARSNIRTILALGLVVVCAPMAATAAVHVVNPGDSIQDAVDAASDGDVVKVNPGDYVETHGGVDAVLITKRLKLIARNTKTEIVRLLPGAGNINGIVVRGTPGALVERVLIKGFTVEDFTNHGIWLEYANKFKLKSNTSANNLHNGIFPTLSTNGLVKNNVAYGALDAGLWVEASENVRVIKNEVYNNPTGIELTISKDVLVKANDVHDNVVGVGLYHPNGSGLPYPGTPGVPYDDGWKIVANQIYDNNFPNPVMGGLVGQLPTGIGTLVIGVNNVLMLKNVLTNNGFVGIAIVNWCDFNNCAADPPVDGDPLPNDNSFIKNTATGNGLDPDPDPMKPNPFAFLAADILRVAPGSTGNCFTGNTATVTNPNPLSPEC